MKLFATFIIGMLAISSKSVMADPGDSILTNYSENGLRQFDFRMHSINQKDQTSQNGATIGLGYGLTTNWFSEIYLSYAKTGSNSTTFDSAAFSNTFLLTDPQSSTDVGLYTEIEYEQNRSDGYQLKLGPLLQTEFGLTTVNLNLLFQRNYLADYSNPMLLEYQWQIKRHWNLPVDFGLQGFGEFGPWNNWAPKAEQTHRIGPALFGKINVGEGKKINYNAAILFDVFDQINATTFRMQMVYGF